MQKQKTVAIGSAIAVIVLTVLTFIGLLPQTIGIVAIFAIICGSDLYLAFILWKKHKKLEACFLGIASILVVLVILFYALG